MVRKEVKILLKRVRGPEISEHARPKAVCMLFRNYSWDMPGLVQKHNDKFGTVRQGFPSEVIDYAWPWRI